MRIRPTAVAFQNENIVILEAGTQSKMSKLLAALTACSIVLLFGATTLAAPPAQARAITHQLDIPAQDLGAALKALGAAANEQVLFSNDVVTGLHSPHLKGEYSTDEAFMLLLKGSGLKVDRTTSGVLLIRSNKPSSPEGISSSPLQGTGTGTDSQRTHASTRVLSEHVNLSEGEGRGQSFWNRFRLAQADQPKTTGDRSAAESRTASEGKPASYLEEVIITARKRAELLLEVPVPVTAISGESLSVNNQSTLRDYYLKVPGLNINMQGAYDGTTISIRGISTGPFNEGTTAVVLDDVPYTSSAQLGDVVVEIDPSELERLEVLRGPQGTLYGASSLGGLLKYVTVEPSVDGVSGQVQAGFSTITNGDGLGSNASAAVNVPMSDTVAFRVSAFKRKTPGWYDNPVFGEEGVNWNDSEGGRASILWRPSDRFSLKLAALLQNVDSGANGYANLLPGETEPRGLNQYTTPNFGGSHGKYRVYSAHIDATVGSVDLSSITAYVNTDRVFEASTRPGAFAFWTQPFFGTDAIGIVPEHHGDKFTQELRASIPLTEKVDWRLGVFYSKEDYDLTATFWALDFDTGEMLGEVLIVHPPSRYTQQSLFSDAVIEFTDRFDLQLGGRYSEHKTESLTTTISGAIFGGGTVTNPAISSTDDALTYLVVPRFRLSPDAMFYGTVATGFRSGGPNPNRGIAGIPDGYEPDETHNYEIGFKGRLFDGLLTLDTSVYYIEWKDMRVANLFSPPPVQLAYTGNVGGAESKGWEFALELRPTESLTIAATGALSEAKLTTDFPDPFGAGNLPEAGDDLPFNPDFAGSLSVDKEFPFIGGSVGHVGATLTYVGDRGSFIGEAQGSPTEMIMSAYDNTDVRVGARWDHLEINIYANNVFDQRNAIVKGFGGSPPEAIALYTQPRTIGVTTTYKF